MLARASPAFGVLPLTQLAACDVLVTPECCEHLRSCTQLTSLSLSTLWTSKQGGSSLRALAAVLPGMTRLRALAVEFTSETGPLKAGRGEDALVEAVVGLASLQSLSLTALSLCEHADALTVLTQLTELGLECRVDDGTVSRLCRQLTGLRSLALDQQDLTDASIVAVGIWLRQLTRLSLYYNDYGRDTPIWDECGSEREHVTRGAVHELRNAGVLVEGM